MTPAQRDQVWATCFPDPDQRAAWLAAFGPKEDQMAAEFAAHFTDPALAKQWRAVFGDADTCAYLHRHGMDPAHRPVAVALLDAAKETTPRLMHRDEAILLRACLLLAHPHLTRTDRDHIAAAGLTLPEVDHLIATGTYDRDRLAVLAGLS